jgi:hypothetical protein
MKCREIDGDQTVCNHSQHEVVDVFDENGGRLFGLSSCLDGRYPRQGRASPIAS